MPYLGEILSLAAPVCWSFAIIVFRKTGESVPPLPLNLFKITVGLTLLSITWAITLQTGREFRPSLRHAPPTFRPA